MRLSERFNFGSDTFDDGTLGAARGKRLLPLLQIVLHDSPFFETRTGQYRDHASGDGVVKLPLQCRMLISLSRRYSRCTTGPGSLPILS